MEILEFWEKSNEWAHYQSYFPPFFPLILFQKHKVVQCFKYCSMLYTYTLNNKVARKKIFLSNVHCHFRLEAGSNDTSLSLNNCLVTLKFCPHQGCPPRPGFIIRIIHRFWKAVDFAWSGPLPKKTQTLTKKNFNIFCKHLFAYLTSLPELFLTVPPIINSSCQCMYFLDSP